MKRSLKDETPKFHENVMALSPTLERQEVIDIKLIHVQSSAVRAIGYHPDTETLFVEYKNHNVYRYPLVSAARFVRIITSESIGAALNDYLTNRTLEYKDLFEKLNDNTFERVYVGAFE